MKMVSDESGMKNSKLNYGESGRKKRVSNILRKLAELREMKPPKSKHSVKIELTLEHVGKLQEEDKKLESMKKLENRNEIQEELKLEDEKKKLEARKKNIQGMPEIAKYFGGSDVIYDRDSIHCYPPEEVQCMKDWAQMAIDVFNQRQPINYIVVDVVRATRCIGLGYVVHLLFIAKAVDDEDAKNFDAYIRCRLGHAEGVKYVDIEK